MPLILEYYFASLVRLLPVFITIGIFSILWNYRSGIMACLVKFMFGEELFAQFFNKTDEYSEESLKDTHDFGVSQSFGTCKSYKTSTSSELKISKNGMRYVKERALTLDKIHRDDIYDSKTKETVHICWILFKKYMICRTEKGYYVFRKFETGRYYNSLAEYDNIQKAAYALYG